nr:ribosome recycling factor [Eggerthellaceae bacterium]
MLNQIKKEAEERMQRALDNLAEAFGAVRTGRANAMVLDRITADYYGTQTPINQMAAIKTPDAHMLVIEPWDKSALRAIEQAIQNSNLGINPSNDGTAIRLAFPQLTEERRVELVKQCKMYAEEARVAIRNARRDANEALEKAKKDGMSEDDQTRGEKEVQKLTDDYVAKVEDAFKKKESEVMEI